MKKEIAKNISKSIKTINNNKRSNNKMLKNNIKLKTNEISNINNVNIEKIEERNFASISNSQYSHEHFNTDFNDNDLDCESNLLKKAKISNSTVFKVTIKNKVDLKNINNVKRLPKCNNSFVNIINNPLKEKETINEEDMPNLNINKELQNRVSIPSYIDYQKYNTNNFNSYSPYINNNSLNLGIVRTS